MTDQRPILLQAMPPSDWDALVALGREMTFSKGETIMLQGSFSTQMFLIRAGRVEISIATADGLKSVLNQMGPGEILGEIALLDGGPRSADAIAASDVVSLIAIDQSTVLRVLGESPDMVMSVIRELCRRVRNASDMFEVKSEKNARTRPRECEQALEGTTGRGAYRADRGRDCPVRLGCDCG